MWFRRQCSIKKKSPGLWLVSQGRRYRSPAGHPGSSLCSELLVYEEEEWLQINQRESITPPPVTWLNLRQTWCPCDPPWWSIWRSYWFIRPSLHICLLCRASGRGHQVTQEASTQRQDLQRRTRWLSPTLAASNRRWGTKLPLNLGICTVNTWSQCNFARRRDYRITRLEARNKNITLLKGGLGLNATKVLETSTQPAVYICASCLLSLLRHSVLFQVPNAPPAYEKIASGPLPPPYFP